MLSGMSAVMLGSRGPLIARKSMFMTVRVSSSDDGNASSRPRSRGSRSRRSGGTAAGSAGSACGGRHVRRGGVAEELDMPDVAVPGGGRPCASQDDRRSTTWLRERSR